MRQIDILVKTGNGFPTLFCGLLIIVITPALSGQAPAPPITPVNNFATEEAVRSIETHDQKTYRPQGNPHLPDSSDPRELLEIVSDWQVLGNELGTQPPVGGSEPLLELLQHRPKLAQKMVDFGELLLDEGKPLSVFEAWALARAAEELKQPPETIAKFQAAGVDLKSDIYDRSAPTRTAAGKAPKFEANLRLELARSYTRQPARRADAIPLHRLGMLDERPLVRRYRLEHFRDFIIMQLQDDRFSTAVKLYEQLIRVEPRILPSDVFPGTLDGFAGLSINREKRFAFFRELEQSEMLPRAKILRLQAWLLEPEPDSPSFERLFRSTDPDKTWDPFFGFTLPTGSNPETPAVMPEIRKATGQPSVLKSGLAPGPPPTEQP